MLRWRLIRRRYESKNTGMSASCVPSSVIIVSAQNAPDLNRDPGVCSLPISASASAAERIVAAAYDRQFTITYPQQTAATVVEQAEAGDVDPLLVGVQASADRAKADRRDADVAVESRVGGVVLAVESRRLAGSGGGAGVGAVRQRPPGRSSAAGLPAASRSGRQGNIPAARRRSRRGCPGARGGCRASW